MSRGTECISKSISECSPLGQDELHRKVMPMIINYDSDTSLDEEDSGDYLPSSSELNPPKFPDPDSGVSISCLDDSVDSSSSSVDDVDFPDGSCDKQTFANLINSKTLKKIQNFENFSSSEQFTIPSSFVVFFYEAMKSGAHSTKSRRFSDIYNSIESTWNKMSLEQRKNYRKRAVNSKKSYSQHLTALKAKLFSEDSRRIPVCAKPICSRSVTADSRWNLQYCSSDCLIDHCKSIFSSRLTPPVLPSYSENNSLTSNGQVLLNQLGCKYDENVIIRDCSVELRQSDVEIAYGNLPLSSSNDAILIENDVSEIVNTSAQVSINIDPEENNPEPPSEKFRESLFERLQWRSSTTFPLLNGKRLTETSEISSFPFIDLNKST